MTKDITNKGRNKKNDRGDGEEINTGDDTKKKIRKKRRKMKFFKKNNKK